MQRQLRYPSYIMPGKQGVFKVKIAGKGDLYIIFFYSNKMMPSNPVFLHGQTWSNMVNTVLSILQKISTNFHIYGTTMSTVLTVLLRRNAQ